MREWLRGFRRCVGKHAGRGAGSWLNRAGRALLVLAHRRQTGRWVEWLNTAAVSGLPDGFEFGETETRELGDEVNRAIEAWLGPRLRHHVQTGRPYPVRGHFGPVRGRPS